MPHPDGRTEFEQYAQQMGRHDFEETSEDGIRRYRNPFTEQLWNFWTASRAALTTQAPAEPAAGYWLAPDELTEDMRHEGFANANGKDGARALWRAMRNKFLASRAVEPGNPANQAEPVSAAARDVLAERRRQVEVEGWTPEHDDAEHEHRELARAAACYAYPAIAELTSVSVWPWGPDWFKSKDERRNLVRAGALILAEIERLDRLPKPRTTCARCTTPEYCRNGLRGCDIAESLESGITPIAGSASDPKGDRT